MKLTPERKVAFLAALAETGMVTRAAKAVDITRETAYSWREDDPEFALAWERAKKIGMVALEDEAYRRAHEGTDKPVFHLGMQCGTVREYSDTLAIFLLKAHDPKYRDNSRVELANPPGETFEVSDAQAAARMAALFAAAQARAAADGSDLV